MRILTAHAIHVATPCYVMHERARAKEEIYSHEGMVSVTLTSLRFNSLGWSITPTFFWIDGFLYQFSTDCEKMNKNQCKKLKIFPFFDPRDIESRQLAAARVCKFCRLKIKFTLRGVTSCFNLLNRSTHIKIGIENSVLDIHLQYF